MFRKLEKVSREYLYDFAVQGGAVGAITLVPVGPNTAALPEGFLVEMVTVVAEEALVAAGGTVTCGPSVDSDGYLVDMVAALGTIGNVVRSGQSAGALLWDNTNDAEITYRVGSAANTQDVVLQVGTAAITAGKLRVRVDGVFPTSRVVG